MNPKVNYRLWVIMLLCQFKFILGRLKKYIYTILMSDVDNGKGYTCLCVCVVGEVRDILEISVPPSQFCCKPKLI